MSIINDALKKTQLSFKKPDKPPEKKPEPPKDQTTSNVYEKLYKKQADQQNATKAAKEQQGKASDKKVSALRSAKRWFKPAIVLIIYCLLIAGGGFFLSRLGPVQNLLSSITKNKNPSRAHIAQKAPKRRVYKPGDLVLNGTSLIDGKRVALINDEIYEVGEIIDGKKIISINLNKIELSDDEKIITLRVH